MIRRLVGSFAFAALLTTGAQAQTVGFTDLSPTAFTLASISGGPQAGLFVIGSVNGVSGFFASTHAPFESYGAGSSFTIWCVDETHSSLPPSTYAASGTVLTSTGPVASFLHDNNVSKSYLDYVKAAWLTTQMSGTNDPANAANNTVMQLAIWKIMGFDPSADAADNVFYAANTAAVAAAVAAANLASNYNSIVLADWFIVTDRTTGCPAGACQQEFLAHNSVVPEPATMALMAMGLVGMAGAGMRRRKK